MELELLKQADLALTKCGGRQKIQGAICVPLFKAYVMPMALEAGQGTVQFTKEITGDTTWSLCAISCTSPPSGLSGVRIQIQFPNGRFLFGGPNGQDIGEFCWFGSWCFLMDPEMDCEPGGKIQVTITATAAVPLVSVPINLLFEGYEKYFLKGGKLFPVPAASSQPRIQGTVNQNILAPPHVGGYATPTPAGKRDDYFIYTQQPQTPLVFTLGAVPFQGTVKIPIDTGIDFYCRRILIDLTPAATVTEAVFLGRIRTGDGYALTDDFIDLAQYLNGAEVPHDWKIRGGDAVFIDLQLTDTTGTGTIGFQAYLEGFKRGPR